MADTTPKADAPKAAANTAVPAHGDHDRVAMLSLKADGTPDQFRPELLDEEAALRASKTQFVEQAVSAADVAGEAARRAEEGAPGVDPDGKQDPTIAKAQDEHEATAKAAEAAAEKAVKALS